MKKNLTAFAKVILKIKVALFTGLGVSLYLF